MVKEQDNQPIIEMTAECYQKIQTLTKLATGEIGGFLSIEDGIITDVHVPPQETTGGSVDIKGKDIAEWMIKEDIPDSKICGLWHSHANIGSFSSGIDDRQFKEWLKETGLKVPYLIELVTSKNSDPLCQILINEPIKIIIEVQIKLRFNLPEVDEWAKRIIGEKLKKPEPKVYHRGNLGYSATTDIKPLPEGECFLQARKGEIEATVGNVNVVLRRFEEHNALSGKWDKPTLKVDYFEIITRVLTSYSSDINEKTVQDFNELVKQINTKKMTAEERMKLATTIKANAEEEMKKTNAKTISYLPNYPSYPNYQGYEDYCG